MRVEALPAVVVDVPAGGSQEALQPAEATSAAQPAVEAVPAVLRTAEAELAELLAASASRIVLTTSISEPSIQTMEPDHPVAIEPEVVEMAVRWARPEVRWEWPAAATISLSAHRDSPDLAIPVAQAAPEAGDPEAQNA